MTSPSWPPPRYHETRTIERNVCESHKSGSALDIVQRSVHLSVRCFQADKQAIKWASREPFLPNQTLPVWSKSTVDTNHLLFISWINLLLIQDMTQLLLFPHLETCANLKPRQSKKGTSLASTLWDEIKCSPRGFSHHQYPVKPFLTSVWPGDGWEKTERVYLVGSIVCKVAEQVC